MPQQLKKILLTALAVCFIGMHAHVARADDSAERLAIAAEYVKISKESMRIDQMVETTLDQIAASFRAGIPDFDTEKEQKMRELARPIFLEQMDRVFFRLDAVIADIFTLEELKAMVAFMGSDVGKSIMSKMPLYLAKVQPAIMNGIQSRMPDIARVLQESGVIPKK